MKKAKCNSLFEILHKRGVADARPLEREAGNRDLAMGFDVRATCNDVVRAQNRDGRSETVAGYADGLGFGSILNAVPVLRTIRGD